MNWEALLIGIGLFMQGLLVLIAWLGYELASEWQPHSLKERLHDRKLDWFLEAYETHWKWWGSLRLYIDMMRMARKQGCSPDDYKKHVTCVLEETIGFATELDCLRRNSTPLFSQAVRPYIDAFFNEIKGVQGELTDDHWRHIDSLPEGSLPLRPIAPEIEALYPIPQDAPLVRTYGKFMDIIPEDLGLPDLQSEVSYFDKGEPDRGRKWPHTK